MSAYLTTSLSQFPLTPAKWRAGGKLRISTRVGQYSSLAGISRVPAGKAQVRDHGAERPNQSLKGKVEGKPTKEKVRIPFPPKRLLASNLGLKRTIWSSTLASEIQGQGDHSSSSLTDSNRARLWANHWAVGSPGGRAQPLPKRNCPSLFGIVKRTGYSWTKNDIECHMTCEGAYLCYLEWTEISLSRKEQLQNINMFEKKRQLEDLPELLEQISPILTFCPSWNSSVRNKQTKKINKLLILE